MVHKQRAGWRRAGAALALLFVGGCSDSTGPPDPGRLQVTVNVVGTGGDPDGIRVVVVGGADTTLAVIDFKGSEMHELAVPPDEYRAHVIGVSPLCERPVSPISARVQPGVATPIIFRLDCVGQFLYESAGTIRYVDHLGGDRVLVEGGVNHVVSVSPDRTRMVTSDSLGSYIRSIAEPHVAIPIRGGGQWSPDGRLILGNARSPGGARLLVLIDAETGVAVDSLPGSWGTWSPDGRRFAYSTGFAVRTFDILTREDVLVHEYGSVSLGEGVRVGRSPQDMLWSPGRYLVTEILFPQGLSFLDMDSGEAIDVPVAAPKRKRWLDETSLVVALYETIAHYSIETGEMTPLLTPGAHKYLNAPNPSPDFSKLLFATNFIFLLDVESGAIRNLVPERADKPVWLPYSGGFVQSPPAPGASSR